MKRIVILLALIHSTASYALIGLPDETCRSIRNEAANLREEAVTGVPAGDTQISAQMDCGGHIPWDQGAEILSQYWNRCAEIYDKIYKDNCDLP